MKSTLRENQVFLYPYLGVTFISIFFLSLYSKASIHMYLNSLNCGFGDVFFKYLTYLGDGIFIPVFLVVMLFIRFRYAFLLVLVYILSGLPVQLLKRVFFYDMARPTKYLENVELHLVPGVKKLSNHSFPSGHSATAFGIMICFAIAVKNRYLKFFFFVLATLIAYSRVYLSQHFLIDITVGAFIGLLTGLLLYEYVKNLKWKWLDMSLTEILHKDRVSEI